MKVRKLRCILANYNNGRVVILAVYSDESRVKVYKTNSHVDAAKVMGKACSDIILETFATPIEH